VITLLYYTVYKYFVCCTKIVLLVLQTKIKCHIEQTYQFV